MNGGRNDNQGPRESRAAAALYVSLVLLVGGFSVIFLLLLRPPALGSLDPALLAAVIAYIGGILAATTLMLRYWFPSSKDDHE